MQCCPEHFCSPGLGAGASTSRKTHPIRISGSGVFSCLWEQRHCLHRNLYDLFPPEFPIDYRNQCHGQNRIQRQAHIQVTEYFAENGDQIEDAQMLIEFQQTDRQHSNHRIQPVRHSLQERGNEHNDKRCSYHNHRGFGFCRNKLGQRGREEVANITADHSQYQSLPESDVIQ